MYSVKPPLNDLLIKNINNYGNVEYNIPMRSSQFETRTSTNVALRHIPCPTTALDCTIKEPLPDKVVGRDMVIQNETYKTTSGAYCMKANNNPPNEKADNATNCKRTIYMTGVERKLLAQNIQKPVRISEMRDMFRGERNPETDNTIRAPDPEYIFDVIACGRNEAPAIPEYGGGFRRLLDPYYTTYRQNYRIYTPDDQHGIGAKDHITYYSESSTPKVRGFGPRMKEIWMPQTATIKRAVWDRSQFKMEYKAVAKRNTSQWLKGAFKTETKSKYTLPFASSPLVTVNHGEIFDLPPYQPTPWQTTIAPAMYCSDYCHIAQGTPVNTVVDQVSKARIQKPCIERYIVSEN